MEKVGKSMPTKRQYKIKGTKDFLALAGIFFFLFLWAVKDAWFPSAKVLKKHPREVPVAFKTAGTVEKIHVRAGDSIAKNLVLADLRSDRIEEQFKVAKETYNSAKKKHSMLEEASRKSPLNETPDDAVPEINESIILAKDAMDAALDKVEELRLSLAATELRSTNKGAIKNVLITPHTVVEAGQAAFIIEPADHFYLFNKSLAVVSLIAFAIFLTIHILLC